MWQIRPVCCHSVGGVNCPEHDRIFICSFIAHNSDRLHRKEHCPRLPYRIIQSMFVQTLYENLIGFLKDLELLPGYFAKNTYCEPRARERVSFDNKIR